MTPRAVLSSRIGLGAGALAPTRHACATESGSKSGSALLIVLVCVSIATTVLLTLQSSAFRQAAQGRESVARIRAYWAARAGLEAMLARYDFNIVNFDEGSAYSTLDDLDELAEGDVGGATWSIVRDEQGRKFDGPADAHAKINVSLMTLDDLLTLDGMSDDVAQSILDWVDADDIPNPMGAEESFYSLMSSPYAPRNAPFRSLEELELVAGVRPEDVRGEDWNLNGRLDPNEDDGDDSFPPDNADGVLDAGWSAIITTESVDGGLATSGQERLYLPSVSEDDLSSRIAGIDLRQAEVILNHARSGQAAMSDYLTTTLQQMAAQQNLSARIQNLSDDALGLLMDECTLVDPAAGVAPGKVNLNTVNRRTLESLTSIPASLADILIYERDARSTGFVRLTDLLDVPEITRQRLGPLSNLIDVRANAVVVTSRGRDATTGLEVEIRATIDRSALPAAISEMLVR